MAPLFGRLILAAGVILVAVVGARRWQTGAADSFHLLPGREPGPRDEAGALLDRFLVAMTGSGEGAEADYEAALAALRQRPEEVIRAVSARTRETDERNYPERWALAYAAAELRHPAALPYLRDLVRAPIPPERSDDTHEFSSVAEETIIRTTAVEGVEHLAVAGVPGALDSLFEFLPLPSTSICAAAVQAIYAADPAGIRRAEMANRIPDVRRFLLGVRRRDAREVPQITDPQRTLDHAPREILRKPPPDRTTAAPPRVAGRNAPQIR